MTFDGYMAFMLVAVALAGFLISFARGIPTADGNVVRHHEQPSRFWVRQLTIWPLVLLFAATLWTHEPSLQLASLALLVLQNLWFLLDALRRRRDAWAEGGEPTKIFWLMIGLIGLVGLLMAAAVYTIAWQPFDRSS